MNRNSVTAIMLTVLASSVSEGSEPEVSESLGRQMQQRAKQVFGFCDEDHGHLLNLNERNDAETKTYKILESMSKEREIGGKRIPPSVDEPLYANPDRVTLDEFVQHFQAMGSIADAKARAMHSSKVKVVYVPVPVRVTDVAFVPMRSPNVFLNPYPVFYSEPHHLYQMDNGAMQAVQAAPVFAAAPPNRSPTCREKRTQRKS